MFFFVSIKVMGRVDRRQEELKGILQFTGTTSSSMSLWKGQAKLSFLNELVEAVMCKQL